MAKFIPEKMYFARSICNSECVWYFVIIKRTDKTVTIKDERNITHRCKISVDSVDNYEYVLPMGKYSMCPVLSAKKIVPESHREYKLYKSRVTLNIQK